MYPNDGVFSDDVNRWFLDWVFEEGSVEQEGRRDPVTQVSDYTPRYFFYLHVGEESLESVVDGELAGKLGGNCVKVLKAGAVVTKDWDEENRKLMGLREEPLDVRKKVRIDEIAELYAALLSIG